MKSFLFILISSFGAVSVYSQKNLVKWGQEIETSDRTTYSEIVCSDKSGVYIGKQNPDSFYGSLDHVDKELNSIRSLNFSSDKKKKVRKILSIKSKLYSLYSIAGDKTNSLYFVEIDKQTLTVKDSEVKFLSAGGSEEDVHFTIKASADTSKILVYSRIKSANRDKDFGTISVFTNDFQLIWQSQIKKPEGQNTIFPFLFRVDNNANVFVIIRSGTYNYFVDEIYTYVDTGKALKKFPIAPDSPDISIVESIFEVQNNKIICAGFYRGRDENEITGVHSLVFDLVNDKVTKDFKEVSTNKFVVPKKYTTWEFGILLTMHIRNGGSAVLMGEEYSQVVDVKKSPVPSLSTDLFVSKTTHQFHYGDIIVTNIDAAGQIKWIKKVTKNQESADTRNFYTSYISGFTTNSSYIVFNDNSKNLAREKDDDPKVYSGSNTVANMVTLDATGSQTVKPLFSNADHDLTLRPGDCAQVSDNELILFCKKGKRQKLGRLILPSN